MADRADYTAFVADRSDRLLRTAYLLTQNWASAEDLLQAALIKAWTAWPRLRDGDPEAYVRKIIITTHISWWRRRWRGELPTAELPDRPIANDSIRNADERDAVWRVLGRLPPRQRAVVVLRYYEDLTEAQTAELLGCSVGTVKSQTAKALAKLRADSSLSPTSANGG